MSFNSPQERSSASQLPNTIAAPLARFRGQRPPAPNWFSTALSCEPNRSFVDVDGTPIEVLEWGLRGNPPLMLLHGKGAHADWWRFIAPFLADSHHVVAMSWSGMGKSGWRTAYSTDVHIAEIEAVAKTTRVFGSSHAPLLVGHSFGALPMLALLARRTQPNGAAVVLDAPLFDPVKRASTLKTIQSREIRPNRIYATEEEALARFRYLPTQTCENDFITDHIARHSLEKLDKPGESGWRWRFDPGQWHNLPPDITTLTLAQIEWPLAFIYGERSKLAGADELAAINAAKKADAPLVMIPDAGHHVMADQPLALISALRALLKTWAPA